jgi:serine/threonine-protein kinase
MAHGTGAGMILGTVGYMSPEQIQATPVDHRSDIFSFGCILYEAATRQRPFAADSDIETLHKLLKEKPAPVEEFNAHVPTDLRRLIRRCLAKSPDERLQSMKDLALSSPRLPKTTTRCPFPRARARRCRCRVLVLACPRDHAGRRWPSPRPS